MNTVDLFCGCGGLSLGFELKGFNIIGAYDSWDAAIESYCTNFSHKAYKLDLSNIDLAISTISPLNPEIIIGGPPCQDFSSAGDRQEGKRAVLTVSYAKIISSIQPKYFVMENVSRARYSMAYKEARVIFKNAGYGLTEQILDASKCGVPQKRKRFFCIGKLNAMDGFLDKYITNKLSAPPLTVREYFTDNNIPIDFEYYYRHPRTYSRRAIYSIDEPSPTIRGVNRPKPPQYMRHKNDAANPDNINALTTNQRAIIQTFPLNFYFSKNQAIAEQMIGNAVPVNLAQYVANAINADNNGTVGTINISFADWLRIKHNFSPLAIKDTLSRINRCNRLKPVVKNDISNYLNILESDCRFKNLSTTIRSQLKRSLTLYDEYTKEVGQ